MRPDLMGAAALVPGCGYLPGATTVMIPAADEYKPIPKTCEDFPFIAQKLRELEREREEARRKDSR